MSLIFKQISLTTISLPLSCLAEFLPVVDMVSLSAASRFFLTELRPSMLDRRTMLEHVVSQFDSTNGYWEYSRFGYRRVFLSDYHCLRRAILNSRTVLSRYSDKTLKRMCILLSTYAPTYGRYSEIADLIVNPMIKSRALTAVIRQLRTDYPKQAFLVSQSIDDDITRWIYLKPLVPKMSLNDLLLALSGLTWIHRCQLNAWIAHRFKRVNSDSSNSCVQNQYLQFCLSRFASN